MAKHIIVQVTLLCTDNMDEADATRVIEEGFSHLDHNDTPSFEEVISWDIRQLGVMKSK